MKNPPYKKRPCDIKMRLVPYGGGWIDVHLDICGESLYFVLSYLRGDPFYALLRALYYLYPENNDPEYHDDFVENRYGVCQKNKNGYEVERIVENIAREEPPCVVQDVPWRADFLWGSEGQTMYKWTLEREPTLATDFMLKITIDETEFEDDATRHREYRAPYKDLCYAVAKTCTEVLKSHGLYGYHHSVYNEDMHLRYLLFIKGIALGNLQARDLTYNDRGNGESSSFEKELELLLFDM